MAHKKGVGSSRNGRDSNPQYRGVKKFGGEKVIAGNITVRQCGTKWHPGNNVGLGTDYTIYSLIEGVVKFEHKSKSRFKVSSYPVSAASSSRASVRATSPRCRASHSPAWRRSCCSRSSATRCAPSSIAAAGRDHDRRDRRVPVERYPCDGARSGCRLVIRAAAQTYDAILLDVDNGPEGLTRRANDWLYGLEGLEAAYTALRPGGVLAVWSAGAEPAFTQRLHKLGFTVEERKVRAHAGKQGARHTIWLATRSG